MVTPETLLDWYRNLTARKWTYDRKGPWRPRISQAVTELVVRIACENPSWGYDRLPGALANLGYTVGSSTVANILKRHGIEPAPERGRRTSFGAEESPTLALALKKRGRRNGEIVHRRSSGQRTQIHLGLHEPVVVLDVGAGAITYTVRDEGNAILFAGVGVAGDEEFSLRLQLKGEQARQCQAKHRRFQRSARGRAQGHLPRQRAG